MEIHIKDILNNFFPYRQSTLIFKLYELYINFIQYKNIFYIII